MEYAIRTECPLTCTNPVDYECGEKVTIEGCHCKAGFVLDNNGNCIAPANCGCRMPDNSTTLMVSNSFLWLLIKFLMMKWAVISGGRGIRE